MNMKLFHLVCVVAAALAASTTGVHAVDGGPASGGANSVNPNNRAPRTESATDGGPMSGSATSVNPNAPRPATAADAGPATAADAGPPMSGGDMSTNPNLRTRTPAPAPVPEPSTPAVTTAAPVATKTPAPVTDKPSATPTEKPPTTITEKPPASITEKPSAAPTDKPTTTPAATLDNSAAGDLKPTPQETGVLDFSVINGDTASNVMGEVAADADEDLVEVVPSKGAAKEPAEGETANEAEEPSKSQTQSQSQYQAAPTPSPMSKKTSNSNGMSSAPRNAQVSGVVVATMAASTLVAVLSL